MREISKFEQDIKIIQKHNRTGIPVKKICGEFEVEVMNRLIRNFEHLKDIISGISVDRLAKICEAERDGRCALLSEPMKPMIISDDPMDSDVYCPACGETLSGGWPNNDSDCGRKLCQCRHCGQSIDDTKVIMRSEAKQASEGDVE